jgi:hypothetical protein
MYESETVSKVMKLPCLNNETKGNSAACLRVCKDPKSFSDSEGRIMNFQFADTVQYTTNIL